MTNLPIPLAVLRTADAARYLASTEGGAARLNGEFRDLVGMLAPPGSRTEDVQRFSQYLAAILDTLLPKAPEAPPKAEAPVPVGAGSNVERIA